MKLSVDWVREHVPVEAEVREITDKLTGAGHAVEGLEEADGDTVLDLEITTNRPDCLSVRGVARELGALYRRPLNDLAPLLEVSEGGRPAEEEVSIQVDVPELCGRFAALSSMAFTSIPATGTTPPLRSAWGRASNITWPVMGTTIPTNR